MVYPTVTKLDKKILFVKKIFTKKQVDSAWILCTTKRVLGFLAEFMYFAVIKQNNETCLDRQIFYNDFSDISETWTKVIKFDFFSKEILFFILWVFCLYVPHACLVTMEARRGVGSPGTVVIDSCEPSCECWELNISPAQVLISWESFVIHRPTNIFTVVVRLFIMIRTLRFNNFS